MLKKLLILSLVFSLYSCTKNKKTEEESPVDTITQIIEQQKNIQSMTYEMETVLIFKLAIIPVNATINIEGQTIMESYKSKMTITTDMLMQKLKTEIYTLKDENNYISYSSINSEPWTKTTAPVSLNENTNPLNNLHLFFELSDNITEIGEEKIGQTNTTKYETTISPANLLKIVDISAMLSSINSDNNKLNLDDVEDIKPIIYINKETLDIVKIELDATSLAKTIVNQADQSQDLPTNIDGVTLTYLITGHNNVKDIIIPQEIIDTAIEE